MIYGLKSSHGLLFTRSLIAFKERIAIYMGCSTAFKHIGTCITRNGIIFDEQS